MTVQEALQNCTVEGYNVKLPAQQLDRKIYLEVAKKLELIGGKWKGGKVFAFVFQTDPTELLKQIQGGENVNLKKEFQFFATPAHIAERMARMAEINPDLQDPEQLILEPSAGQGALIKAMHAVSNNDQFIHCFEPMQVNKMMLDKIQGVIHLGDDFLAYKGGTMWDIIVANPPFAKNQDIDHIRKMYQHLKKGGRLVTIASKHWQISSNAKETAFKNWLCDVGAEIHEIPAGEFAESGTKVSTCLIKIVK